MALFLTGWMEVRVKQFHLAEKMMEVTWLKLLIYSRGFFAHGNILMPTIN
jgi:hypothetical protein